MAPEAKGGTPLPVAGRLLRPLERFLHVEAVSGLVLLAAAALALAWANSRWAGSYEALWHAPITLGAGAFVVTNSLHFWINDGLMTIFFLVVGLEIRREMHEGALSTPQLAALPAIGALGGIIAPALLYLAFTADGGLARGWAVPTATDIAFAVGVLALLGRRVPGALRALLLAIAIIDDIAAILVIAFFYASGIEPGGLALAAVGVLAVLGLQRLGLQSAIPYLLPGVLVWFGLLEAGIHPTLAGVILGLMTPTRVPAGRGPLEDASRALEELSARMQRTSHDPHELMPPVRALKRANRDLLPPDVRLQFMLHPWVAYAVMPLFALANAGVQLEGTTWDSHSSDVMFGVFAGLVLGKPLGVVLATAIAVRCGIASLPPGVTWRGVLLLGILAGIGFTMSIFIANLAFPDAATLASAKLAVLLGSGAAALLGLIAGWQLLRVPASSRRYAERGAPP